MQLEPNEQMNRRTLPFIMAFFSSSTHECRSFQIYQISGMLLVRWSWILSADFSFIWSSVSFIANTSKHKWSVFPIYDIFRQERSWTVLCDTPLFSKFGNNCWEHCGGALTVQSLTLKTPLQTDWATAVRPHTHGFRLWAPSHLIRSTRNYLVEPSDTWTRWGQEAWKRKCPGCLCLTPDELFRNYSVGRAGQVTGRPHLRPE